MASKSNAFGQASFRDWTDWEIKQFLKIAKKYFGSENYNYYLDFESEIEDKVFTIHGEGKWHIKSTMLAIKEAMLDRRLSDDDLDFLALMKMEGLVIKFTFIDEEGSLEWLEESKGELRSLGNTLEYESLWEKQHFYTRDNLRKFDLYEEFEVDEEEFAKELLEKYPDLNVQAYIAMDKLINHKPHESKENLEMLIDEMLGNLNLI